MAPTEAAATESKKMKRELDVYDLKELFDTELAGCKVAWNDLKHGINELDSNARQRIPSVNFIR